MPAAAGINCSRLQPVRPSINDAADVPVRGRGVSGERGGLSIARLPKQLLLGGRVRRERSLRQTPVLHLTRRHHRRLPRRPRCLLPALVHALPPHVQAKDELVRGKHKGERNAGKRAPHRRGMRRTQRLNSAAADRAGLLAHKLEVSFSLSHKLCPCLTPSVQD